MLRNHHQLTAASHETVVASSLQMSLGNKIALLASDVLIDAYIEIDPEHASGPLVSRPSGEVKTWPNQRRSGPTCRAAASACTLLTSIIRPQAVQLSRYFVPTENSGMKKSENLRFCLVS